MTQNKKKGIAKKALSISLVAAMLATSNVPAWASGFEAVDAEGFAVEEAVAEEAELLAAPTATDVLTNAASVTDELDENISWLDTASMNAILDEAAKLMAADTYNMTAAPEIVFINGDVATDGTLTANSVEAGVYTKDVNFKEHYGEKIAVKVRVQKADEAEKTLYLANEARVTDVDLGTDVTKVFGWELTVNGKTYTDTTAATAVIDKAAEYKVTNAKLYLTKDKTVSVNLADADAGVSFVPTNPAVNGKLAVAITVTTANENHVTMADLSLADVAKVVGQDLAAKVSFGSTNLTYNPNQKADANLVQKLVEAGAVTVDSKLSANDYVIKLYSNNTGAEYASNAVIPAGNLYVGVVGQNDYAGQSVFNPTPITVAKKDLSTLAEVQSVIDAIKWDGSATTAKSNIDNKKATMVTYDKTETSAFSLAQDNATKEKLDVKITYPEKAGDAATITVTPAKDNTNYTGTKVITFIPKVEGTDLNIDSAFGAAVKDFDYDAKSHVVNNLVTTDLGDLLRSQYTLSVKGSPVTEIKDAGHYTIVLTVNDGPYKGITKETELVISPRNVSSLFNNGNGVSSNAVVYNLDGYGATNDEKLALVNPTFVYNGETLDANDMDGNVTLTFGSGAGTNVTAAFVGKGNYTGNASVTLGQIQRKDISLLELPEIPTKQYDGTTYTLLTQIAMENAAGEAKTYDELVVDGKAKTQLVKDTDYILDIVAPENGVGTYTITLRGKGNYTGAVTKKFEVTKNEITADIGTFVNGQFANTLNPVRYTNETATSKEGITLNFATANNATAGIIVRDRATGKNVAANCTFTYTENRVAGTATVEATGKDGFEIYANATFKIIPQELTAPVVTLDQKGNNGITDTWSYTGESVEPKVVANFKDSDGKYTLKEGVDYEVVYSDNVKASANASVTVKGLGNYVFANKNNTGAVKTFTIQKTPLTMANIVVNDVEYAGGLQVTPDVTVYNPVTMKALDKDLYTFTFVDNTGINAGSATANLVLTAKGEEGYTETIDAITFMITKKPLSKCTASVVDGKVVIKNGDITVPASEYTVTDNEDGTFTVKAAEKNYTGTITVAAETSPEATTLRVTDRTTSTVSLAWDEVDGAEGYTIWFRSEYETSVSRKIITGGDATTWTQKGLQPGTKYFYTVKAWVKDADGNYVFSEQSPVQRGTTKPLAAKITAVSAANGKVKVTLAGKAAGAEMYSMCYSKSANFDDFKVGIRTSYTTRTFKNALTAGTYYVRVKSYRDLGNNKRVYGAWSNTMKVVVK